jgi:hypothetical protein
VNEIREQAIMSILKSINEQIKKGRLVKYRGKEVVELDIVETNYGPRIVKRIYIKYKDETINVLSFSDFLSRRIEVR